MFTNIAELKPKDKSKDFNNNISRCFLNTSATAQKLNTHTPAVRCTCLSHSHSSVSEKKNWTPQNSINYSPCPQRKTTARRCFSQIQKGSKVLPLCNSVPYTLALPSVSIQHLKRRFLFPGVPLCSVAPRWVTTQPEKDPPQPHTYICVYLCVCSNNPYQFSLLNTLFLKPDSFTWGSHCK